LEGLLGKQGRDLVTGYKGIVVCVTTWMNQCRRITLQSQEMKDGKPVETICIDFEQLKIIGKGLSIEAKPSGGPMPSPLRAPEPRRT